MKYKNLKIGDKVYRNSKHIERELKKRNFYWVIDSECENADMEIKHDTLIWNDGKWDHGSWEFGIFLGGEFYGKWENGIFENGVFKGKWISGIDYTEKIKNQSKKNEEKQTINSRER